MAMRHGLMDVNWSLTWSFNDIKKSIVDKESHEKNIVWAKDNNENEIKFMVSMYTLCWFKTRCDLRMARY